MPTTVNEHADRAGADAQSIRETQHAIVEAVKTWATAVRAAS